MHTLTIALRPSPSWREIFDVLLRRQGTRAVLGLALMIAQAFFYNAISFTYALVLSNHYGVADERVGAYMLPFALGNFLGPLLLGRFFDTVGRRRMIAGTYSAAAIGLLLRLRLHPRLAQRQYTSVLLVGDLLHGLGGGQRRLPHSE